MITPMSEETLRQVRTEMRALTQLVSLPFRQLQWKGTLGSLGGQNAGSSIEFHDQRPYLPGDDPRHLNWQAYARTGNYTMKLFSEEVAPKVDLLFDTSESMFLNPEKTRRSWELVYFCIESALRHDSSLKIYTSSPQLQEHPIDLVIAGKWNFPQRANTSVESSIRHLVQQAPLRMGSLRILISDLLDETPPDEIAPLLAQSNGKAMIFCPWSQEEAHPQWSGNYDFEDCESSMTARSHVNDDILKLYLDSYQRHFQIWRGQAQKQGMALARVPSEVPMIESLRADAIPNGALSLR